MTKTDTEAITATSLDYFEGWFHGDTARMERALHPELAKRRAGKELGITTKPRMVELTAQMAGIEDRADGRVQIDVHDIYFGSNENLLARSSASRSG